MEEIEYRGEKILLHPAIDYNSSMGVYVEIFRWSVNGAGGQANTLEQAIKDAHNFIDWKIEDPEFNNIF